MSARRVVDLVVAGVALALVGPLFLVVALAVRAGSSGPVFFRQVRTGRGGRPFVLLKFRTMWHGSSGPSVTEAADARVTPIGAWLRRWKIDELPQLVNLLRGEMTLIGPRPEVPHYLARLGALGRDYAAVEPGLADAATLAFYDEAELLAGAADAERYYLEVILPEKARLSVAYARERSLGSDVRLLWALARRIAGGRQSAPTWREFHAEIGRQARR